MYLLEKDSIDQMVNDLDTYLSTPENIYDVSVDPKLCPDNYTPITTAGQAVLGSLFGDAYQLEVNYRPIKHIKNVDETSSSRYSAQVGIKLKDISVFSDEAELQEYLGIVAGDQTLIFVIKEPSPLANGQLAQPIFVVTFTEHPAVSDALCANFNSEFVPLSSQPLTTHLEFN